MKTGAIIAIVAVILVVLVAVFALGLFKTSSETGSTSDSEAENSLMPVPGDESEDVDEVAFGDNSGNVENLEFTVQINNSGFFPKDLEINQGDAVAWINMGSSSSWPASAMHPTHTVYPGSSINKCGVAEEDSIYDACRGLKNGESYVFTFNEVGSWGYHDHLNPTHFGKITVK